MHINSILTHEKFRQFIKFSSLEEAISVPAQAGKPPMQAAEPLTFLALRTRGGIYIHVYAFSTLV